MVGDACRAQVRVELRADVVVERDVVDVAHQREACVRLARRTSPSRAPRAPQSLREVPSRPCSPWCSTTRTMSTLAASRRAMRSSVELPLHGVRLIAEEREVGDGGEPAARDVRLDRVDERCSPARRPSPGRARTDRSARRLPPTGTAPQVRMRSPIVTAIGANSIGSWTARAVGARVDDAHARDDVRFARERRTDEHHPELVGAGFDRRASRRHPAVGEGAQRGEIAHVEADRAGVVLAEHDAIEPAFGRDAQRVQVGVAVAHARLQVRIEIRSELGAQPRRLRRVARRSAADREGSHSVAATARHRRRTGTTRPARAPGRRSARAASPSRTARTRRSPGSRGSPPALGAACTRRRATSRGCGRRRARRTSPCRPRRRRRARRRRVVAQPAHDRVRIAGDDVVPEQRARRLDDARARDRAEQLRQLRGHRTVVEGDDHHRHREDGRDERRELHRRVRFVAAARSLACVAREPAGRRGEQRLDEV